MNFYGLKSNGMQTRNAWFSNDMVTATACHECSALAASRNQIVLPTPCPPGGLLAIGEAPGCEEDEIGEGFVGAAGRTLDELLDRNGLERNRDYGVANIVRCRPPNNRRPTKDEVASCLPRLGEFLLECKPKVLLLVGKTAVEVFMGRGDLTWHINRTTHSPILLAKDAHPALQPAIRSLHVLVGGAVVIPMPHTSGMAWNRKAPDGRRWCEIGAEQAAIAAMVLRNRR